MLSADAELLARGVVGDADRPASGAVLAAVGERQLVDQPVGRGRVDELPARVEQGACGGDLRAARPFAVAGRGERPQDLAAVGVDRERPAVGGRDHHRVVRGSVDERAVQVDRRGVDRARKLHRRAAQVRHVRARDPGRGFAHVAALRVEPELGPFEQAPGCGGLGRRRNRSGGGARRGGRRRRAAAGRQERAGGRRERQAREVEGAHPPMF